MHLVQIVDCWILIKVDVFSTTQMCFYNSYRILYLLACVFKSSCQLLYWRNAEPNFSPKLNIQICQHIMSGFVFFIGRIYHLKITRLSSSWGNCQNMTLYSFCFSENSLFQRFQITFEPIHKLPDTYHHYPNHSNTQLLPQVFINLRQHKLFIVFLIYHYSRTSRYGHLFCGQFPMFRQNSHIYIFKKLYNMDFL